MLAILKTSRRLLCLGIMFFPIQLPAQTVDTDCREFGGRISCTSKAREPVENSWVTLQKTLDSIAESRRRRKEEKDRQLEDRKRSDLLDLEIRRGEQENAKIWLLARKKTADDYNNKNYMESVSSAIMDGRCDDGNFLSLKRSDLDTAQKVKSLCISKNEMKFPIHNPKTASEKYIMGVFYNYWTGKSVHFFPIAISVLGGQSGYRQSVRNGLLFLDYGMGNGEPDAFYFSAMMRVTLGALPTNPKMAYIINKIGAYFDKRSDQKQSFEESNLFVSFLSDKEKSEADAYIRSCTSDVRECLKRDRFLYNL